jgi:large subunit ribosomal protein L10
MATSKAKKNHQLALLVEKMKSGAGFAFVKFDGPSVNEVQQARRDLRDQGMSYTVIKKTLIAIAAKEAGVAEFGADDLEGAVAVIISESDEIAPAAAIKKLKKEHTDKETKLAKFDFAGAVFEGKLLDPMATAALANTATREESLAKVIATLRRGPQGIHSALTHGLRGITLSLKEADKYATA